MKHYIGIDLGTTNSVISSFNGSETRIWKSPEGQTDVTPSALFIDKRGNKFCGQKAYNFSSQYPDNSATLFKRLMGTSTPISFAGITMTPEECSSEVLKTLFGYLPDEIRNNEDTATVITVPAAFNQMQNAATLAAAQMAGLGNVALMQEPVAAIMCIMKSQKQDGNFLVYDLGGGTLDIAIAESIGGKVNLLAHGGIAVCGGRDFDRLIFNSVVAPWISKNFNLPVDYKGALQYKLFHRLAQRAVEDAKIALSSKEIATIALSEIQAMSKDLDGNELYLDVAFTRDDYNKIIDNMINETIEAAREIINKSGLSVYDFDKVVFIGGPTGYKPLRDKVSKELGIPASYEINPMTAVADGASIFAESIDWATKSHNRKSTSNEMKAVEKLGLSFKYIQRTNSENAKIAISINNHTGEYFIEIRCNETGWISGKMKIKNGMQTQVPLSKNGDNAFSVTIVDSTGKNVQIDDSMIIITKTMATVGAIPSSHSIGIETKDRLGGAMMLEYIVREGDPLPKKGTIKFKSETTIRAGSLDSLAFKLWEGEVESPIEDNRYIGALPITGQDLDDQDIHSGADIDCTYEVSDSNSMFIEVAIPSIGATFTGKNFYSYQEGQIDLTTASDMLYDKAESLLERIEQLENKVNDPRLQRAREKTESAINSIDNKVDAEDVKKASEDVEQAKKYISQARKDNLSTIRKMELDNAIQFFFESVANYASEAESSNFNTLVAYANKVINGDNSAFEVQLQEINSLTFKILFKQDWFIIDMFRNYTENPFMYTNLNLFNLLKAQGLLCIKNDDIEGLRSVIFALHDIRMSTGDDEGLMMANIIRG